MAEKYIKHHGILGQKWGVRRFQNPDGTLTPAGRERYDEKNEGNNAPSKRKLTDKQKLAIKIGAAVVLTALAAIGAYKYSEYIKTSAAKDVVNKGNATASDLMKKVGEYTVRAGAVFPNVPGSFNNHIVFTNKAMQAQNEANMALNKATDLANEYLKSFPKSYKYLKDLKKGV